MQATRKSRILLSKIGLDAHNRGVKLVAHFLRDAGMEVIYLGPFQTVEDIVRAATQEDVDVIGISALEGSEVPQIKKLVERLKEVGVGDIPVIVGGIIPKRDADLLKAFGVKGVFPAGTPMVEVVEGVRKISMIKGAAHA